jgi:hypothetical protein
MDILALVDILQRNMGLITIANHMDGWAVVR